MNSREAKRKLSDLLQRVEIEHRSAIFEVEWIEMKQIMRREGLWAKNDLAATWFFIGYLMFDRRGNSQTALRYRIEQFQANATVTVPSLEDHFGVLVYASTVQEGFPDFIDTLGCIIADWGIASKAYKERVMRVVGEFKLNLNSRAETLVDEYIGLLTL